jgi:hypothetical protein
MEDNKLYLMFRWGKQTLFNVQRGKIAIFNVQMGDNNSVYCSDGEQQIEFTVQMGDNNSV